MESSMRYGPPGHIELEVLSRERYLDRSAEIERLRKQVLGCAVAWT